LHASRASPELIYVRGWVSPRPMTRLKGLTNFKEFPEEAFKRDNCVYMEFLFQSSLIVAFGPAKQ
jgi:hypothetical protein